MASTKESTVIDAVQINAAAFLTNTASAPGALCPVTQETAVSANTALTAGSTMYEKMFSASAVQHRKAALGKSRKRHIAGGEINGGHGGNKARHGRAYPRGEGLKSGKDVDLGFKHDKREHGAHKIGKRFRLFPVGDVDIQAFTDAARIMTPVRVQSPAKAGERLRRGLQRRFRGAVHGSAVSPSGSNIPPSESRSSSGSASAKPE